MNNLKLIGFCFCLIAFLGCEDTEEMRTYIEPIPKTAPLKSQMGSLPTNSNLDKPDYVFESPNTWVPTRGDAMRLISLGSPSGSDISVTYLGGKAGNLSANLERWARQIDLQLSPEQLTELIDNAEFITRTDRIKGKVYDFTPYITGDQSIIAMIFDETQGVLFVKAMGPKNGIINDRLDLITFAQSLALKPDSP